MKVHEIMTAHARCVGPENTLVEAAGLMRELDVGALPVCEEDRIAGMVTDRDIALRGVADGRDPNTTAVRDVMSPGIVYVFADQEVEEIARLMEQRQIRRVPVLSREKRLVGIVSLGDIAISSNLAFSGMALREVSEPRNPTARQRRLAERSQPPQKRQMTSGRAASSSVGAEDRRSTTSRRSATKRTPATKRSKRSTTRAGSESTRRSAAKGSGRKSTSSTTRSKSGRTSARTTR